MWAEPAYDAVTRAVRGRPLARTAVAALLVVLAWLHGRALHGSNTLVAEAADARWIDEAVRDVPDGSTVVFIPPTQRARLVTVNGLSVHALHAGRGVSAAFDDEARSTVPGGAQSRRVLMAFDDLGSGTWRPMLVAQAAYASTSTPWALLGDREVVVQRFRVNRRELELYLRASAYGRDCTLEYRVMEMPDEGTTDAPTPLDSGQHSCRAIGTGQYVSVARIRRAHSAADAILEVSLSLRRDRPGTGHLMFLLARGDQHSFPVKRCAADGICHPDPGGATLAFRLVVLAGP